MRFFKRKLLYPAKRAKDLPHPFDELHKAYVQHLKAIKPKLPEAAWKLACFSFHDARVVEVQRPSKQLLSITLDGVWGYDFINKQPLKERYVTLEFLGVKKAWVPDTIPGDIWLYEEINLSDVARFDYQVLLAKDEIRIQADDVKIQFYDCYPSTL